MQGGDPHDSKALTSAQVAIWSGQALQPDDPLYNMVLAFRISGALRAAEFQLAFQGLVDGCDALRTVVESADGMPRQRVLPQFGYALPVVDLSRSEDVQAALDAWLTEHSARRFDLSRGAFDSALLRLADDCHVWYLNQHHILTDATSVKLLFDQQQSLYRRACDATLDQVPALPAFADYVRFESAQRDTPQHRQATTYWSAQMAQPHSPSRFYQHPAQTCGGRTERIEVPLGAQRSKQLRELATVTPFRAFTPDLALFQIFATALFACLSRVTGNTALALGAPSHNRAAASLRRTAGLLIEILPLRVAVDADDSFVALHRKVAQATGQMMRNAPAGVSRVRQHRAFDVVLNFITASFGDFDGLPTQASWLHTGYGDSHHLLRVQVENFGRDALLKVFFDMHTEIFGPHEQRWLSGHFLRLVDAMLADPVQSIADVDLVGASDGPILLAGYRSGAPAASPAVDLVTLFEQQVAQHPDAVALRCGDREIRYSELDRRAAALANELLTRGIGSGAIVAVLFERSPAAVVAMLGILRSGAAFLPLDPLYPTSRLGFMCSDAKVALILADREAPELARVAPLLPYSVDGPLPDGPPFNGRAAQPDDLAYVIYTSGSTGNPKGVMIERRCIANYLGWARETYLGGEPLAFALFSSLSFDLTLTSILLPLVSGGSIVVYPGSGDAGDPALLNVMADNRVDIVKLTPSHLALIQAMDLSTSRLRAMILGGEDLKTDVVRATLRRCGGAVRVYNEYGPTEATIGCMIHLFDPQVDTAASVPIGRAIDGLDVYVLDSARRLVPAGIAGEIHIAGVGLARGYLGQEERTAEKFVDNPFRPGTRMYASGDLGAWNARGELTYLGRCDRQVKVRGVRVEPGEIESALNGYGGITDCAVEALSHASRIAAPEVVHCSVCGLSALHPEAHVDAQGVCRICRIYTAHRDQAQAYFSDMRELEDIVSRARGAAAGGADSMMLLSGGKDSTYALCRLVDLGLRPLVFTLDNGFISDGATANVRRVVADLGLELVVGQTPAMNAIFADSLRRFSNVCNGCFKTVYTLSMNLARQRGIRYVFTGLSRGQIFETRVAGLFQQQVFDRQLIDRAVLQARKVYHRMDDAVARHLDVREFADDTIFEAVEFVDFYRYCEVTLEEILDYLARKVNWIRPVDTGRSTNCRINEVGIHVHQRERGFHNYSMPYSWDVRLGHKERNAALAELNDQIDLGNVERILEEVGYRVEDAAAQRSDHYLVAYYVSPRALPTEALKAHLATHLPAALIPTHFMHLAAMPLTANGKIDRAALPTPDGTRPALGVDYVAPRNEAELQLATIWQDILGLDRIGIHDNFFDLGGDSVHSIQIVARARAHGFGLTPQQLFDTPTVAELAPALPRSPPEPVKPQAADGPVRMLAGQIALLAASTPADMHAAVIDLAAPPDADALRQALAQLVAHHDGLRARFQVDGDGWRQEILSVAGVQVAVEPLRADVPSPIDDFIAATRFDIAAAPLFRVGWAQHGTGGVVVLVVHSLVIDSVSWRVVLEDLASAYAAACQGQVATLAAKTTSLRQWADAVHAYGASDLARERARRWLDPRARAASPAPADVVDRRWACSEAKLDAAATAQLLQEAPGVYRAQLPELILTALLRATAALARGRQRRVEIEAHGRADLVHGLDLMRTVGQLAVTAPLLVRGALDGDPGSALLEVKRAWRELPNGGLDFALARHLGTDPEITRQLAQAVPADLRFRYLGQMDRALAAGSGMSLARPLALPLADQRLPLEVSAFVFRDQLTLRCSYASDVLDAAVVDGFAGRTLDTLRELLANCLDVGEHHSSDVDVAATNLNRDELESLLAEFGKPGH